MIKNIPPLCTVAPIYSLIWSYICLRRVKVSDTRVPPVLLSYLQMVFVNLWSSCLARCCATLFV